jgi:hypothetical protein
MKEIEVICPCCGAKFSYPENDPIHQRDQLDLFRKETDGRMSEVRPSLRRQEIPE